jgi:transposase
VLLDCHRAAVLYRLNDSGIIERAFRNIKDYRRVATRYDELARNVRATVMLAAILIWWT